MLYDAPTAATPTKCKTLRRGEKVQKAKTRPLLKKLHQRKMTLICENKTIFRNERRATLEGPDDAASIQHNNL